jgi:hypothetical protein
MHLWLFTLYALHYMSLSHTCIFVVDPVEQKPEELPESAPVEETNLEQEQGKPRCIKQAFLIFGLPLYLNWGSCMCIRL